jgi:PAS domain S-box-containing protein
MRMLFAAAALAIIVMLVVNVVAIRLIANDNSQLHDRATPSLLAAKSLTLAAADMNGAQNRYVLDFGSSRGDYIQSRDQLTDAITEATRHAEAPGELALIREISHLNTGFQTLDGQIYAAVLARKDGRARTLAAGPATSIYTQMRSTAEQLVVLTTRDRTAAFSKLTSAQRRAQIALVVLDAVALVLISYLLIERRRTGRRLAAQHEAYRGLVERMPAVTVIYDRDTDRFRYVSPRAGEILGVEPEEILADPQAWISRIHPDDLVRFGQETEDGANPYDATYRFTRPDGSQRWLQNVTVRADSAGDPALEALVIDVTERVETVERYRSLVEQLPAAVVLADPDGTCFWVSSQWETLCGLPAESMVGSTVPERLIAMSHPGDRARISSWVAHREAEEPFTDRFRLQHADGRWLWVEIQVVVVRGSDGQTAYRQALLRDVTDRIVAEARYQELVEHQAGVTTLYDAPARTTLYLSPQVEELTGYPPEYWLSDEHNQEWWGWQVIHPDDREAVIADWLETFSRDELWEGQYRIIHRDGSVRWIADRDAPLEGTDGLRQGSTLDITDLVEQRTRYQELIEALPAAVVVYDPRTMEATYVSPQFELITGRSTEQWLAEGLDAYGEMTHPDDRTDGFHRAMTDETPSTNTYRLCLADGRVRWVTSTDHVLRTMAPLRQALVFDVTDEVSTEQRFQALVEQTPAAIGSYDPDRFTYASPGLVQLSGIPSAEFLSAGGVGLWQGLVLPEDLAVLVPGYEAALAERRPWRGDYRMRNRETGETRWVSSTDQTVAGLAPLRQVVTVDVTDLVEQRTRYQELIEALPAAVVVYDPGTGGITYVSPQLEGITGLTLEDWHARGVGAYRAMVHPDDRSEGFEKAIAAGEPFSNTYRLRAADGQERWVTSTDHVLRNLAPLRQALVYDVTDEVEERTRHQDLIEALPAAVAVYDQDTGQITYASPQMEQLTGIPASVWLGRAVDDYLGMIHPADSHLVEEFQSALAAGTEALSFRYRLIAADGSERWVASTDNELPGMTHMRQVLLFDVTELHEAEQRSQEAVERMVRAGEEEQARIAGELHDDAVQVMTALLYQVRMLGGDEARSSQMEEMLAGLIERTRRLMFELRPATLERDGIKPAIGELVRDGPWSSATVDIDVPRQSETVEALSYRTIRELVVNARKHSQADTLTVTGRAHDGVLEFSVVDDGVGFDVGQARDPVQMRGHLGLDTMIERIRLAGGKVDISSSPGQGARTVFTMPAAPREDPAPSPQT